MEDAANAVMQPVDEQDSFTGSGENSQASLPNDTSLPSDDPNDMSNALNDSSSRRLMPENQMTTRRSIESNMSSDENNSLLRASSRPEGEQDPRGEAPPYFEVVDLGSNRNIHSTSATPDISSSPPPSASSPATPPAGDTASRRRSGLRSFFHSIAPSISSMSRHPPPPIPMSRDPTSTDHTRELSGPSVMSVASSSSPPRRHRPSTSSASVLPFRTSSLRRSTSNLNNTSQVSLHSISAPLTHTLIRTEFTYPKAGPTPQQLKLISSRESFARFGMPYGPDAIAYAASTSRHDLEPPPGFDESARTDAPRRTHLRDRSSSSLVPASDLSHRRDTSVGSNNSSIENTRTASQQPLEPPTSPRQPSPLSPIPSSSPIDPPTVTATASSPVASLSLSTYPPSSALAPPSSFRTPQAPPPRSESRASSVLTNNSYATAAESMGESDDTHTPTTPTMPTTHMMIQTDTTVNQPTV
jgi:hypothetical protein